MFGMFLRRAAFATLLALLAASVGCVTQRPPYADAVNDEIVFGGTQDEREHVRDALGYLEQPVRHALTRIHITDDCPQYMPKHKDGRWKESAHCHPLTRKVCIHPVYVEDAVVWHESAHALFMTRSRRDQSAWEAISEDAYGDKTGEFPRDGILTSYGATNEREDFAEWVEWAVCYFYDTPTGKTYVDLRSVDATDTRYIRHLKCLRDWGAISEAQYAQLEPLFTLRLNGAPME